MSAELLQTTGRWAIIHKRGHKTSSKAEADGLVAEAAAEIVALRDALATANAGLESARRLAQSILEEVGQ